MLSCSAREQCPRKEHPYCPLLFAFDNTGTGAWTTCSEITALEVVDIWMPTWYRNLFSLESSKHSAQHFYIQGSYGHGEINPDGKEAECRERGPLRRDILSESFHCRVHCSLSMLGAQKHWTATCSLLAPGPMPGHCLHLRRGGPGGRKKLITVSVANYPQSPLPTP